MVHEKGITLVTAPHPGEGEHHSRHRISNNQGSIRTETESRSIFRLIQQQFGILKIDLFAFRISTQLPRFFSRRLDQKVEAISLSTFLAATIMPTLHGQYFSTTTTSQEVNNPTAPHSTSTSLGSRSTTGHLRRSCEESQLSKETTDLLMASWRSKFQSKYNSHSQVEVLV